MMKCLNCQQPLTGKYTKKFCSRSCSASYTNRFKTKHGKYSEKECVICKKLTVNPKFCSQTCAGLGKRKYQTTEEWLDARRKLGRENYARYAAQKKFQTPVDENLQEIKQFYLNCPAGYEVDHIIPISKGGSHTLENLQYLTIEQNRSKGSKLNWRPQDDSNV